MMKWMSLALVAGLFITVGLTGCGDTGKSGPGVGDKRLSVTGPATGVTVKPGATEKFTVSVTREKFDEDVTLDITGLPDGVTLEDSSPKLQKGVTRKELTLKAADTAKETETGGKEATIVAKGGGLTTDPAKFTVHVRK